MSSSLALNSKTSVSYRVYQKTIKQLEVQGRYKYCHVHKTQRQAICRSMRIHVTLDTMYLSV